MPPKMTELEKYDSGTAKSALKHMGMATTMSPFGLRKIAEAEIFSSLVLRLIRAHPAAMSVIMEAAKQELIATRKDIKEAAKLKRRQKRRAPDEQSRRTKKIRHDQGLQGSSSGSVEDQHANSDQSVVNPREAQMSTTGDDIVMERTSGGESDDEEANLFIEELAPIKLESADTVLDAPNDSSTQGASNDGTKSNAAANDNDETMMDMTLQSEAQRREETEMGITEGTPVSIDSHINTYLQVYPGVGWAKKPREMLARELFGKIKDLNFWVCRWALCDFLDKCRKKLGKSGQNIQTREPTTPAAALNMLITLGDSKLGISIRHVYLQMRLHSMVLDQSDATSRCPKQILKELVTNEAALVNNDLDPKALKQLKTRGARDYYAGGSWHEICNCFGGSATVLVLLVTDITASDLEKPVYRQCLHYISDHLYGTKQLVKRLGENALGDFCRDGCLSAELVDSIRYFNAYE